MLSSDSAVGEGYKVKDINPWSWLMMFRDLEQQDAKAAIKRAMVNGIIDGNKPYSDQEAADLGVTNINDLEFADTMDRINEGYFDLSHAVGNRITVSLEALKPEFQGINFSRAERIIAQEFTKAVAKWTGFATDEELSITSLTAHGHGHFRFRPGTDWRPIALLPGDLLVPRKSPIDVNQLGVAFIRSTITIAELEEKVKAAETIKSGQGWNVDLIKRLMDKYKVCRTQEDMAAHNEQQAELVRRQEANRDASRGATSSPEEETTNSALSNELRDAVMPWESIAIVEVLQDFGAEGVGSYLVLNDTELSIEALYRKDNAYENMTQALTLTILRQPRTKDFYAVKGMGERFYNTQLDNLLIRNGLRDRVKTTLPIFFKDGGEMGTEAPTLDLNKPVNVLPKGVDLPAHGSLTQGLAEVMGLVRFFDGRANTKSQNQTEKMDFLSNFNTPRSAKEFDAVERQAGKIQHTYVSKFYKQRDLLWQEMFRRLLLSSKEGSKATHVAIAKAFMDACELYGLPKELFDPNNVAIHVKAARAIGDGSEADRSSNLNRLQAFASSFPQTGKDRWLRDTVAAAVGHEGATEYLGPINEGLPDHDIFTIVALENVSFALGMPMPVHPDQAHLEHFKSHMQALDQPSPNLNMVQIFQMLQIAYQHLAQHLEGAMQNPLTAGEAEQYQSALQDMAKNIQQMQPQVQQYQEMQAQSQGGLSESEQVKLQVEMKRVENEFILQRERDAGKRQLKEEEVRHRMALREEKSNR